MVPNLVDPTPSSVAREIDELRARAVKLAARLSRSQFNWQPEGGRHWSIGQCLDHLARGNTVYVNALGPTIEAARPRRPTEPFVARANGLGRWFAGVLEPPVRRKMKAPKLIQPGTEFEVDVTLRHLDDSLVRLAALVPKAWRIDPNRTRFKNPLLGGLPVFNVTAAFQILTAHCRRHLAQAERVRARADWPA